MDYGLASQSSRMSDDWKKNTTTNTSVSITFLYLTSNGL